MMSFLLFQQIAQMFVCAFLGWILVRLGYLKTSDSRILSVLSMYIIYPCVEINAFRIDYSSEIVQGLLLSLAGAITAHIVMYLILFIIKKPLRLTAVEQASILYTNAGSLVIPIVGAVLGTEWVIYCSMYMMVQQIAVWIHGRIIISGEKEISIKKVLLNINVIACFAGLSIFFLRIPLPKIIGGAISSIADTVAPFVMFVVGMLIAGADMKDIIRRPNIWKTTILRLIVMPLLVTCALKYSGLSELADESMNILLITLIAASTPSAATVTQIAQMYSDEGEYASAINVFTTLLCIVTMPLVVAFYQL